MAAGLMVSATGTEPLRIDLEANQLLVNSVPVDPEVPGAATVMAALAAHGARMIALPAGLPSDKWREFGELLAASPGLYPTTGHMQAALEGVAAGAKYVGAKAGVPSDPDSALAVPIGVDEPTRDRPIDPSVTSTSADRAELSARLDPLLVSVREAVARKDWHSLAGALLGLRGLADDADEATRSIIARERRRALPQQALTGLVKLLAAEGRSTGIEAAVGSLGFDGATTIVDRLGEASARSERRLLVDALCRIEGIDELIIRQLGSANPALVVDIAAVAGNRRMEAAIPALSRQLNHTDESVRAACWRALEDIGTVAALAALSRGRS